MKLDLGHGVSAELLRSEGEGAPEAVALHHPCTGGEDSFARLPLAPITATGWALESEAPLTISPSVLCLGCGHHGFIRGGRWIPV